VVFLYFLARPDWRKGYMVFLIFFLQDIVVALAEIGWR